MSSPKKFIVDKCNSYHLDSEFTQVHIARHIPDMTGSDSRSIMIETLRSLLTIAYSLTDKRLKMIVISVMFKFMIEYDGIIDEILKSPYFMNVIVNKLVEFSAERELGLQIIGEDFLKNETTYFKNILSENNHHKMVNLLEDTLT